MATDTTTAAQPRAIRTTARRIPPRARRPVQKGMRDKIQNRGEWDVEITSHTPHPTHLWSGEQLFEKAQGPRIVRLTQPEDCLAAQVRVLVLLGDPDQRGHTFVARPLRQGKYRGLAHFAVRTAVIDQIGQPASGGVPCRLPQPEDG